MLTSGVSSARVCPSSSCKALLAASPLHVSHAHGLLGTLKGTFVSLCCRRRRRCTDEDVQVVLSLSNTTANSQKPEHTQGARALWSYTSLRELGPHWRLMVMMPASTQASRGSA